MCPVPTHWSEKRIKYLAQINPPKSEVRSWPDDTEVTFLPMEAIGERGELDTSRARPIGDVVNGYTYFGEGDVLLAKITPCFENGKGAIASGLLNGVGFATTEVIPLRSLAGCDNRFLYYLLYADPFRAIAEGSMYGAGGQKRVADSFVANFPVEVPDYDEQVAIADFLNRETHKIDDLVSRLVGTAGGMQSATNGMVGLLLERRNAVISAAVTGKIDVRNAV